jgi:hypothetical protein
MKWPLSARISLGVSLLIALCALGVILWLRYAPPAKPSYDTTQHPVTEAPAPKRVARARRVKTPPPKEIRAYNPAELAGKLEMPELNFTDNTLVLDVATIPSHTGDTTAVATLSPGGTGKILYRQEKPPFLDLKREWGVRAGFGTGSLVPCARRNIRSSPSGRPDRDGGKGVRKK